MTDTRLRELERRFRASGAVEDEAAWLAARVRAGELSRAALELAAWVAHPAAERALASPELDPDQVRARAFTRANQRFDASPGDALVMNLDPRGTLSNWLGELGRKHPAAAHRAAAAAAQSLFAAGLEHGTTQEAVRRLERWILAPTEAHRAAVLAPLAPAGNPLWLSHLLSSVSPDVPNRAWRARLATEGIVHAHPDGDRAVRPAIRDELSAWTLGYGDPLVERSRGY